MRTHRRTAVPSASAVAALLVAVTAVVGGAAPAGADCGGPTFRNEAGPVDRGATLTVEGTGFGDNCYDTGPPPDGQGVLGKPLAGISVFILQGGEEHLVAEGAADADYEFRVDVVVPAGLEPGEAGVEVRYAGDIGAFIPEPTPFTVSDAPPVEGASEDPVAFGPASGEPEVVEVPGEGGDGGAGVPLRRGGEGDPPIVPFVVSGLVVLAVLAVLVVRRVRRDAVDGTVDGAVDGDPPAAGPGLRD